MDGVYLLIALARAGEHARAVAAAEDLVSKNSSNALYFDAVCVLALSAAAVKDDSKLREK